MKKIILVDGFNLLSRAYFATAYGKEEEQLPKNTQGKYINALRVFFAKLKQLEHALDATHMTVAWDGKRADTKRNQDHAFYKAQRKDLPRPLIEQYELAAEMLPQIGIHQMQVAGYEADDIIGSFSYQEKEGHSYIYSNDRDMFQLLSQNTDQLFMKKKQEIHYTHEDFYRDYEILPDQWIDVKALLGDPGDNIPGCPGVGEKSALPLIKQYGTVEALYEKIEELDPLYKRYYKKLSDGRDSVAISKELVTIEKNLEAVKNVSESDTLLPKDNELQQTVLRDHGLIK